MPSAALSSRGGLIDNPVQGLGAAGPGPAAGRLWWRRRRPWDGGDRPPEPAKVTVTATAAGKQVKFDVPAQLKAGATELTLVNNTKEAAELQLVQLDEGHTLAEFYPALESEEGAQPQYERGGVGSLEVTDDATGAQLPTTAAQIRAKELARTTTGSRPAGSRPAPTRSPSATAVASSTMW